MNEIKQALYDRRITGVEICRTGFDQAYVSRVTNGLIKPSGRFCQAVNTLANAPIIDTTGVTGWPLKLFFDYMNIPAPYGFTPVDKMYLTTYEDNQVDSIAAPYLVAYEPNGLLTVARILKPGGDVYLLEPNLKKIAREVSRGEMNLSDMVTIMGANKGMPIASLSDTRSLEMAIRSVDLDTSNSKLEFDTPDWLTPYLITNRGEK